MGCANSSQDVAYEIAYEARAAPQALKTSAPPEAAKGKGKARGKGKGKGRGSGKGKGKGKGKKGGASKFQIELEQKFENYGAEEDGILKRAYLIGHPNAKYHLRGQDYEYNFKTMKQRNLGTGKERRIRPPCGMTPPKAPLLPPGAVVVIVVPEGSAGKTITIKDPLNPGQKLEVAVPAGAKKGAKMAVPVPQKGETSADVKKRQEGYSTGAKVAMGTAAVGVAAVGGVILGDHLSGGAISEAVPELAAAGEWVEGAAEDAGEWTVGAAEDVGEWLEGAVEDVAEWGEDAGEWIAGAAEDAGEWTEGAAEDVAEWVGGAWEDIGEWLGDAADDTGDFVMSLF